MKNIPRYRIGNDLTVFWAIHNRDGSPYDLKDKEIHLYVTNERGREEVKATLSDLPDGSQNNVIRWDYRGETQRVLGLYTLTVEIQSSEEHREITRDYCEAFTLVSRSDMENEEGEANISVGGDLILSSKLDIYKFKAIDADVSDIKIDINKINNSIKDLEAEIKLKASQSSVELLNKQLLNIKNSVADLTLRANELEAEIELRASVESVNLLKDSLGSIKSSIAELGIRADEISAEIELKASREEVTLLGDSIQKVDKAVAQQIIKVEGLEASIENLVSKETFDAVTGELDEAYTSVKTTVDGVITTIKDQSGEIASIKESVSGVSVSLGTVKNDVDALRNQVDGVTESYFYPYSPTLSNEPAASWIREGKEAEHKGDTFTNTSEDGEGAGRSWRWLQSENGEWGWKAISDADAIKALQMAAKAQETADGKCTTFYTQPANYSFGDLWFVHNGNYSPYKKGEILSATQDSDYFDLSHWEPKTSYTEAINELDNTMKTSFRDGVLDDAERNTIAENLKNLSKEKSALDSRYNTLIINADFADGELKEEYRSIKREYDSAYNSLVSVVERILLASTEDLASLFEEYETKSEAYESALSEYNSCEERVREALMGSMNYAHVYLDNIAKDGVITPVEKEQLFEIYRNIAREYDTTVGNAYNYKIWKYAEGGESETIGNNGQDGRYEAYLRYKAAYAPILSAFTSPLWGFDKMSETTKLEDSLTVSRLKGYFEDYYSAHGELWNIFSAITASIEEAQKKAEETLKKLTDCLTPEEMTTLIGRGVVLSTIIATKDADGKITAGMNATNLFVHSEHGRVVIAGGVKDIEDWNTASGRIYEDGHFVINSGEISDEVRIGNATLKNVIQATSQFDVVAVPYKDKNGETAFLPLFTVNRNSDGEVVSVSSVYDFVGNKNIWAAEEISANGLNLGGGGSGGGGSTTLDGLIDVILSSPQSGNILVFNGTHWVNKPQSELVPEVDLSDYYTKQQTQNAITSALSPYIKATDADGKYAALASFNALQSSFDRLYSALNDDTSGVINTWNEVVDFVNEYSGSEDLSTILGKMNTDINARVKVSDFDTWKTDVFNPLSVTVTNLGNKVNDHTDKINKILSWFELREDEDLLITTHNLASYKEISSNGISQGTGGGGSGLISSVLGAGSLGATLTNDNSVVFNAYATNEIYKATQGHASRIGVLESQVGQLATQSTKVSVSDLLTTGTKIATITVDGVAHEVKGDFLPTSGGTITGGLILSSPNSDYALHFQTGLGAGWIGYQADRDRWFVTNRNWSVDYTLLHSGNYSQYALPLTGGLMKDAATIQWGNNKCSWDNVANGFIGISNTLEDDSFGYYAGLSFKGYYGLQLRTFGGRSSNLAFRGFNATNWGDWKTIAFTDSNVASADVIAKTYANESIHYALDSKIRLISNTNSNAVADGFPERWVSGISAVSNYVGWQLVTSAGAAENPFFRSIQDTGKWKPWRKLAFLDDNVASATKLEDNTAFTAWGQIFFENGKPKNVSGDIYLYPYELKGNRGATIISTVGSWCHIGGGAASQGWPTYLDGNTISLRYGTSHTTGLFLNSSGNVTIGASDLAGTRAKLFVQGKLAAYSVRTNELRLGESHEGTTMYLNDWYYASIGYEYSDSKPNTLKPDIVFKTMLNTYAEGTGEERMRIKAGGNVGIGTSNPQYKLDVNGAIRFAPRTIWGQSFDGTGDISGHLSVGKVLSQVTANRAELSVISLDDNPCDIMLGHSGRHTWSITGRSASSSNPNCLGVYNYDNGAYRLIINSSGNVTIGGSDLAGTSAKLYVDGTLTVSGASSFASKTTHNGGIGATSLNVSGTSTLSGHVGIGANPHSTYALYVDGSLRCGPIDGGTASLGALYSNTHVPNSNNAYDLGSTSYRWASIYGVGADLSGNLTVNGTLYANGTLYTNDIDGSNIYITASGNLYLTTASGYFGAQNQRWAIDGYGNYKGQSLYINPRDNDNEIITDNNKKKTHGFPREGVAVFVNGDIAATGEISANALNQGSDIRFKNQLGDITLDLGTIANAPMFRFTWTNKENSRVQIGTSAQYWKDSARELVSVDKDDFHRLDYATLGVLIGVTLGKTVKNHEDRIKELETKVESLEAENRRLRYGN